MPSTLARPDMVFLVPTLWTGVSCDSKLSFGRTKSTKVKEHEKACAGACTRTNKIEDETKKQTKTKSNKKT
jgi:hypothetical protein